MKYSNLKKGLLLKSYQGKISGSDLIKKYSEVTNYSLQTSLAQKEC